MLKLLGDDRTPLVMLALMFGLAAANWPFLPDRLPIHWSSADASPDSYASKAFALLFLPVYTVIQYWIFRMVSRRTAPQQLMRHADGAPDDAGDSYWTWTTTLLTAVMFVAYADLLIAFRGHRIHAVALLGLVLVAIAPLFSHVDRNPLVGVRTPWTLKSDYSWKRTHRAAAWSIYVGGPVLIAADILGVALGAPEIGGGLLTWTGALTVYSYVQWRNDPDRG